MNYLNEIKEIWSMVLSKMREKFSATAVNLWFGDAEIISFSNNILTISASSEFKMQIINEKYITHIEEIFEEFMGFKIPIKVISGGAAVSVDKIKNQISTPSEDLVPDRSSNDDPERSDRQPVLGSTMPTVNFEYTFDNFIVGSSNKFAFLLYRASVKR